MKEEEKNSKLNISNLSEKVNNFFSHIQYVPAAEKIFFAQHLQVMVKSGISLTKGIEMLAKQTKNRRFKAILYSIYTDLNKGGTLADGLKKYPGVFDELFINMIASGEASGNLENVLKQLHQQMKKSHKLKGKIRGALTYPAIILIVMVIIGAGVMIYVVPKFISIFQEVEIELPFMTKMLILASRAITEHGLIAGITLLVIIIMLIRFYKTKTGKKWFSYGILRVPIVNNIIKKINLARFSRTMSSLLKTDIKIIESFKITAKTISNIKYRESLEEAAEKVKKGQLINEILAEYPDLYNHVILQMISVGEETGELDNILDDIAKFYEEEVEEVMNTLPSIIEPVIIVLLAVGIGAMAVAIIMPMYQLTNAF